VENIGVVEILTILGFLGGFLATIATLIWRLAVLTTKIDKVERTGKLAHTRLDKYVEKHESSFDELRQQVNMILQVQSKIESKLSLLLDGKVKLN